MCFADFATATSTQHNHRRYLAARAEALGADILPGFAATALLPHAYPSPESASVDAVGGVRTGDFGVSKTGCKESRGGYTPGTDIRARATLLAEGCRGFLSEQVVRRFALRERAGADAQSYGLGLKEVWQVCDFFYSLRVLTSSLIRRLRFVAGGRFAVCSEWCFVLFCVLYV